MDQSKLLDLNIYEIRVDQPFIKNTTAIDAFLYECQCALLLVDITNKDSFQIIQDLLKVINVSKFPYLKLILILNKIDLENIRQITSYEITEFLNDKKYLDYQEISLKSNDSLKELLKKINTAVNGTKNQLPINIISEALVNHRNFINTQNALSFILIGDNNVGKKTFLTRYSRNFNQQFNETFLSTNGIEKEIKYIKVGNDCYKITLWITAGQDRFKCLPKRYCIGADGVLLFFDVTNKETFKFIINRINDIKDIKDKININKEGRKDSEFVPYLIGNKIDLPERVISKEEAETQAKIFGIKYFEVSCKINMNIPEVMARIIMECHMKKTHKVNCCMLNSKSSEGENKKGCYEEKKEIKKK